MINHNKETLNQQSCIHHELKKNSIATTKNKKGRGLHADEEGKKTQLNENWYLRGTNDWENIKTKK